MSSSKRDGARRLSPGLAFWLAAVGVILSLTSTLQAEDNRKFVILMAAVPKSGSDAPSFASLTDDILENYFDPAGNPNIDSFAEYWAEISYNQVSVSGNVFGPISLPWRIFPQGVTPAEASQDFEYVELNGSGRFGLGSGEVVNEGRMAFSFDEDTGFRPGLSDGFWTPGERFGDESGDGDYTPGDIWIYDILGDCEPDSDLGDLVEAYDDCWAEPYYDAQDATGQNNGQYDEGETYLDLNDNDTYDSAAGNGVWDVVGAEPFFDRDGDCEYSEGENFFDANGNGEWDPAEPFADNDQSGSWDEGEPLCDFDGDSEWTDAEWFADANGNGRFDGPEEFVDLPPFNGVRDLGSLPGLPTGVTWPPGPPPGQTGTWRWPTCGGAPQSPNATEEVFIDLNCNGIYEETPVEYLDVYPPGDLNEQWDAPEPFEDFLVRYDPMGSETYGYMVPVTRRYILNNYPGNACELLARMNNGEWDGPDSWFDAPGTAAERTTKMIEVPPAVTTIAFTTPEPYADINSNNAPDTGEPNWLTTTPDHLLPEESSGGFWQNYYGSTAPDWPSGPVLEVRPFDPEAAWMVAGGPSSRVEGGLLDDAFYVGAWVLTEDVSADPSLYNIGPPPPGNCPPGCTLLPVRGSDDYPTVVPTEGFGESTEGLQSYAYYDGRAEFDDLASSIYHLRSWAARRSSWMSWFTSPETVRTVENPVRGVGDGRLGEVTSPYNNAIWGHDRVTVDGNPFTDFVIMSAGPYANNVHGDGGADGGNLMTLEMLTRRTDGDHWTGFADYNLDGLIDQGEVRVWEPGGAGTDTANYVVDGDPHTANDGTRAVYPYNRTRLVEDTIAALDEGTDWDQFFQNRGGRKRISGSVFIPDDVGANGNPQGGAGGRPFFVLPAPGETLRVHTLDDDAESAYAFSEWVYPIGAPGEGGPTTEFGVGTVCHEWLHVWEAYPDLYDYDEYQPGAIVNRPVAGFCIMANGFVHPVGILKTGTGSADGFTHDPWMTPVDLKTVLTPGEETTITLPAIEFIGENAYYTFSNPARSNEQFWFWHVADQGFDEDMPGFGMLILHTDLDFVDSEGQANQRGPNRFAYRIIQADGLQELEGGEGFGDPGDPWPGSTGATQWNANTDPPSKWYDTATGLPGVRSGLEIVDIDTAPDALSSTVTFSWLPTEVPFLKFSEIGSSVGGQLEIEFTIGDSFGGTTADFYLVSSNDTFPDPLPSTVSTFDKDDELNSLVTSSFNVNVTTLADGDHWIFAKLNPGVGQDGQNEAVLTVFPASSNRGNGALQGVSTPDLPNLRAEVWTVECINETTPGSEVWEVTPSLILSGDPDRTSFFVTAGGVQTTTDGLLSFRIVPGGNRFRLGDKFVILTTGLTAFSEPFHVEGGQVGPPPVAVIQASPASGNHPLTVNFDGSASYAPDGTIAAYDWDFGDGEGAGGPGVAQVSHTYDTPGTYTAVLTVTNNRDATDSDETLITVSNRAPSVQLSADDQVVPRNVDVTFTYNISEPDGDGILYKRLEFGDGQFVDLPDLSGQVMHSYDTLSPSESQPYAVTLTVQDEFYDGTSGEGQAVVNILVVNRIPTVTFDFEILDIEPPYDVRFTADARAEDGSPLTTVDEDGDPLTYSWNFGDSSQGSGQVVTHSYAQGGRYTVVLTLSDGIDTATHQESFDLGTNNDPVASFTWAVAPAPNPGNLTISFDASASFDPDPGGMITAHEWNFGDGQTGTGVTVNHTFPSPKLYLVTLTVRDERDGVGRSSQSVAVGDIPNQRPTARLTASDNYGNTPFTVNFDATASTDPDGDPLTYSWAFGDGGTAAGAIVSHTYRTGGTFQAIVTVRDPDGASHSAFLYISVVDTGDGGDGTGCGISIFGSSLACLFGLSLVRWRRRRL